MKGQFSICPLFTLNHCCFYWCDQQQKIGEVDIHGDYKYSFPKKIICINQKEKQNESEELNQIIMTALAIILALTLKPAQRLNPLNPTRPHILFRGNAVLNAFRQRHFIGIFEFATEGNATGDGGDFNGSARL